MAELLPCPFCGGEAKLVKRKFKTGFYPSGGTFYVHCKACLITTQPRQKAEDVIEVWNTRAPKEKRELDKHLRREGTWTLYKDGSGVCSECGRTQMNMYDQDSWQNYCGHCGAKMTAITTKGSK